MPIFKRPPLFELSLAVQFGEDIGITPSMVRQLQDIVGPEYSGFNLRDPIQPLGVPAGPVFKTTDELRPRYWFFTPDEHFLLQVQSNLIAVNWRKRSEVGQAPEVSYPGFVKMRALFYQFFDEIMALVGRKKAPAPAVINLYYDNLWLLQDGETSATYFAFWKTVGISLLGGPNVFLSVPLQSEQLGQAARIDVNTLVGRTITPSGKIFPVAKLTLSGLAFPSNADAIANSFVELHDSVHSLFAKLITPKAKALWR